MHKKLTSRPNAHKYTSGLLQKHVQIRLAQRAKSAITYWKLLQILLDTNSFVQILQKTQNPSITTLSYNTLLVGNMQRAITDCSAALDLMKPECSANYLDRVTCIVRRGKALFKFGMKERGFREIEIAYKMQPDNDELKQLLIDFMDDMNNTEKQEDINDMDDPLIEVQSQLQNSTV